MADSTTRLDSFSFLETHPKWLRALHLKTFNLDFNRLPTFYNLRKLSVIDVKYRPPTLGHWLNLLRVMPHLVDLAIMNSISPSAPSTDVGQRVPLPNLNVLSLMGQVGGQGGIDTFLSYIDTSQGCNLYFAGRFKNMTAAFNDAGLVAWFERWNDEDYKNRALHARFSMGQLVMYNQSGQKPRPGLWFNIYFVNYFSVGADNSRYVQYIRQAAASLVSALTPVISRTERLSLSWTRTSSYPDVAYLYQDFLPSFLPLFRSLQMLHIAVKDREPRPYSPEYLSEILGPFMVQNAIRWAGE
ncbi:hypothetical protein NLJ89_g4898 [Agrocybe chaxingu]|uniref:Uncharacterized protein n=1 Tax=Agrocybe chaxingu TaxID=84603 RepID=A0A9W8K271_9AGAR|nr:hypothetical protein NLJ89_g4898 [Agrocybe chaxingu]